MAAKGGIIGLADYLAKAVQEPSGTFLATATQALDYVKSRLGTGKRVTGQSPPQALSSAPKPGVVERAYDPAAMERQLRIEARIRQPHRQDHRAVGRAQGLQSILRDRADANAAGSGYAGTCAARRQYN